MLVIGQSIGIEITFGLLAFVWKIANVYAPPQLRGAAQGAEDGFTRWSVRSAIRIQCYGFGQRPDAALELEWHDAFQLGERALDGAVRIRQIEISR